MNMPAVFAVAKLSFREFFRQPEAVFWTYGFPLLMTIVLGFTFRPAAPPLIRVAVVASADAAALCAVLAKNPRLAVAVLDAATADQSLARGRIQALVRGPSGDLTVRADPMRPDAELARLQIERALRGGDWQGPHQEAEDRPGARYIDFLVPGLVGLNLLGAGMWGIGFNLTEYRSKKLLRRLFVTPLRRSEFLLGFLLSRLTLLIPESVVILAFGMLCWDVPFRGSMVAASAILIVAALSFVGLGILVASRARTVEGVAGLMNLCQLPMWLLGGSFFSAEHLDGALGAVAAAMPLTQCNNALRDLMLEPKGLADVAYPLCFLSGFAALSFTLALRLFRWT